MHQHDHAERAEPARLELRQIVARDVFHHPPAALDDAAVAGDECDAQDMVAHGPEPLSQRPRGGRRHHRAEGAAREPGGIEAEPGAAVGELLAQQVAANPGLRGGGEILGLDGRDPVEASRGER